MPRKYGYHYPEDFHEDPDFVMNARQSEFFNKFKTACESAGGRMISTQYHNAHIPLWYRCKQCRQPHYNTWNNYHHGYNVLFLCPACNINAAPDIEFIRRTFSLRGAFLLTQHYVNEKQKLEFLCSNCGHLHSITWSDYQQGVNSNLVCPLCRDNVSPSIDFIKRIFLERGSVLLSGTYLNSRQKLKFRCYCGKIHFISWRDFRCSLTGHLCPQCIRQFYVNPESVSFRRNTEKGGTHWSNLVRLFFHVKSNKQGLAPSGKEIFTGHHIYQYSKFPLLQSSITNGYPIQMVFHRNNSCNLFKLVHSDKWASPESWNTDEFRDNYHEYYESLKLPYHNYLHFSFHDLTKYLITETVLDNTDLDVIHRHEKYWKNKGRIYIPVSWKEYTYKPDRDRFFSQIRDELRQFIPEIDRYTGVGYKL